MKSNPRSKFHLASAAAALVICVTGLQAGTVTTTFSFQKGDLRRDDTLHGSGAGYAGVVDGSFQDNTATSALTAVATATIGNQYQGGSPNGRNFIGLFSYDLTELDDFITANTSSSSSVTVTSVSLRLVASGSTSGSSNGTIALYQTDPFTSSATWSNYTTATPWTVPYQNIGSAAQFGYTGGGSALTTNLGGTSPTTGSKTAGSPLEWTSSANFIAALTNALGSADKTLYLMAARGLGNADGRVGVNTSTAATVDNRPELVVTLSVSSLSDWTGAISDSWATAGNWTSAPATGDNIRFNSSSIANLATVLNQDFDLNGLALIDPSGPVSISGGNSLTLGSGGLDLSAASQNLTISAPLVLGATQIWNVAAGRNLSVSGAVTGSGDLTVFGEGVVSLGAANILPNGAGAGNLIVNGTLDLNGFSQAMNGLSGTGTIDNVAGGGSITLTVGNNDAASTFSGTLQETSGTLGLLKVGAGSLTLVNANTFSGGFTNNGSGVLYPRNNDAFGTGPVVMNGSTIYATAGSYTFGNALALNGATLRVGGGNNRTITWNGPVTATGTSGLSADGGTAGITLADTLDITGATFGSYANGTTNTITGNISAAGGTLNMTGGTLNIDGAFSGAGSTISMTAGTLNINGDFSGTDSAVNVSGGTLQLSGAGTYTGTTTLSGSGVFRLQPFGTISSDSNVVINTAGNFNVRNTVGWVYTGTISGDDTGQVNLNSGTNAVLDGDISGVVNINVNSGGTDTTISGDISGITNVNVQNTGAAILRLGGNNSYSGNTTIANTGILILESANALPDGSAVSIASGTLNATVAGTDSAGTLDVTSAATINLSAGAKLAFADSSAVDWTGGTLNLTGDLVFGGPNGSLRFGTDANGLTATQISSISASGYTAFGLDADGFLTAAVGTAYDVWSGGAEFDADANGDGVKNGVAFLLGAADPSENAIGRLPAVSHSGGALVLTFNCLNAASRGSAVLNVEHSSDLGIADPWAAAAVPETSGGPVNGVSFTVTPGSPLNSVVATMPATEAAAGKLFGRLTGTPN